MFLIFDTETTGFYNPKIGHTHPGQARVCSLGAVLLDHELKEVEAFHTLLKPRGYWKMTKGAQEVHGISIEECYEKGMEPKDAIGRFWEMYSKSHILASFNLEFDKNMLSVEVDNITPVWYPSVVINELCLMEVSTEICKLPFSDGSKKKYGHEYKWPKLEEAYKIICGKTIEGAHNSLVDSRAASEIFIHLAKNALFRPDIGQFISDVCKQKEKETNESAK